MRQPGFTLLEVLISLGVLFVTASAIIALSNSLIQGTIGGANKTVTNRWASEGLELVTNIRDNRVKTSARDSNGNFLWFGPAVSSSSYGWYKLTGNDTAGWQLSLASNSSKLALSDIVTQAGLAEPLTSDQLTGFRLICVEALAAASPTTTTDVSCNTDANGQPIDDGSRNQAQLPNCQVNDSYCQLTQPSLNQNATTQPKLITAGNAIKVRSIVVWPDRTNFRLSSMAQLVTNWQQP